jgi:hypothetical protein
MWCSKIHIYIELSKFSVRQIPPLFLFWIICVTIKSLLKTLRCWTNMSNLILTWRRIKDITLTHNAKADTMNSQALHDLKELITNRMWRLPWENISDRRKFKT